MNNRFERIVEELGEYRWITIQDCSEMMGISTRTLYKYLKEEKIKGVIYQRRRLIDSISVIKHLLENKCLEINEIRNEGVKKELTYSNF